MNSQDHIRMVEDIAYIKSKVEYLPDLQKKVECNSHSIFQVKGWLSALSIYGTIVLPIVSSIIGYLVWKKIS